MSEIPHKLFLASAGTGKTYKLAVQFVGLLMKGVEPERILATTFTRKAAGEILDRVLSHLVEAIEDEKKLAELQRELHSEEVEVSRESCVALLAKLTRALGQLKVKTLDAFFASVAKVYALDLGLPPDWAIVDEVTANDLKSDAIARMLSEDKEDQWALLLRQLSSAAPRGVHEAILKTVSDCQDAFVESDQRAWGSVKTPAWVLGEEELASALKELEEAPTPLKKDGTPNVPFQKAVKKVVEEVTAGRGFSLLDSKLVESSLAETNKYSGKNFEDAFVAPMLLVARHIGALAVDRTVQKNSATYGFLELFGFAHEVLQSEESSYRFEDLPQRLAAKDGIDPLTQAGYDLWYRIDGRVDHLLLDEFQDTSPVQYRILERIIEEILADGTGERSLFCVGDVKQSIYGFREADPRLLGQLSDRLPILKEVEETLEKSWRSSPVVLGMVNSVFESVSRSSALSEGEELDAAEEFQGFFKEHSAAKTEKRGAAYFIESRPKTDSEKDWAPVLERTVERIQQIQAEEKTASIGVLVRTSKRIPELIFHLREANVLASGEGGNPLTDSTAVLQALSALHWLDHPGDTQARFHVASSFLGAELGVHETGDATEVLRALRRRLVRAGYGAFLGSLLPTVVAKYSDWDQRRFERLVDLAHTYDERAGLRPRAFVEFVRSERIEDPSAARVKVMTVHRSKGLEFDAVILPELDGGFFPRHPALYTSRPDPYQLIKSVSSAPKASICEVSDELRDLRYHHRTRGMVDNLCLLYVAMTRARHRLDIISQYCPADKYPGKGLASLARRALVPEGVLPDEKTGELWAHPENSRTWLEERSLESTCETAPCPEFSLAETTTARRLSRQAPSVQRTLGVVDASELFSESGGAARHGTLVHKLAEAIEWLDEAVEMTDGHLEGALKSEGASEEEAGRAITAFREALGQPAIKALLSREGHGSSSEVKISNERRFSLLLRDEEDAEYLSNGSIDRLVLSYEEGEVVSAEVIDFKTDGVREEGVEERARHHAPQMYSYRRAVSTMYSLKPEMVKLRLAFTGPGVVYDLP
jgi:ATP-dependent helicase/nuclease subunit A